MLHPMWCMLAEWEGKWEGDKWVGGINGLGASLKED